ncbi:hypothetical protein Hanom_Chr09g00837791 [Helianthus anomalus]
MLLEKQPPLPLLQLLLLLVGLLVGDSESLVKPLFSSSSSTLISNFAIGRSLSSCLWSRHFFHSTRSICFFLKP